MLISHVVAMAENQVIGSAGGLPWHVPEDLKLFKRTTMGKAMLMGRKTFQSIGRPLPGRLSIVVTRNAAFRPPGVVVVASVEDGLAYGEAHAGDWGEEICVIGGGELFRTTMALVGCIYLTRLRTTVAGDTFYPEIPPAQFAVVSSEAYPDASTPFVFEVLKRRA